MRSRSSLTIWPTIHFYSKLTISLLTILSIVNYLICRAGVAEPGGGG